MIMFPPDEDDVIDGAMHQNMYTSPFISHTDLPGKNLMTVGEFRPHERPDPSVGGVNGGANMNGYSTGIVKRFRRFTGAYLLGQKVSNPVQGNVGHSARAAQLYQGVMTQLTNYTPNQAEYAASYLGVKADGHTVVVAGV